MSDAEDDYMSDKFLQGTEKYEPTSLLYRHSDKRELELMKKKAEIEARLKEKKSSKTIEQEKREEGLSSAIKSSNKGFELLMKMGYKPGQGIGKSESGITEPIGVAVKANRHGLGQKQKEKEKKDSTNSTSKLNNENMRDFRNRIAQKKMEQLVKTDLYRSQKICEELDGKMQIDKPIESWFWLPKTEENQEGNESTDEDDSEDTDDESVAVNEKLEILTRYLRKKHYYCIWCGVAYKDDDDLRDSCPGDARADH